MKRTRYFLITPSDSLIWLLQESELRNLINPVMWSADEYDRGILHPSDSELIVKIMFLDVLNREHESEPDFSVVFQDFSISPDYFDHFWSIKLVEIDMSVEMAMDDAVASGTINYLNVHGNNRINDFLNLYRR